MTRHDFGVLLGLAYQGFVDRLHAYLAKHGFEELGATTGYVVRALDASPGIAQRELAARLGVTEQRAGQIVEELIRKKFVARMVDPEDARARKLELGPRGKELLKVARRFHAAYEKELEGELGAAAGTCRRVLEHVVASSADDTAAGRLRAT